MDFLKRWVFVLFLVIFILTGVTWLLMVHFVVECEYDNKKYNISPVNLVSR